MLIIVVKLGPISTYSPISIIPILPRHLSRDIYGWKHSEVLDKIGHPAGIPRLLSVTLQFLAFFFVVWKHLAQHQSENFEIAQSVMAVTWYPI